jgi:hypothetical protein
MTFAGANIRFDIWRTGWVGADDDVGGAVITGSFVYTGVQGRMQADMPSQLLLQQGLETTRTFTATLFPGTLDVRERDEVIVSDPFDHVYHDKWFRVVGVQYSDFNPRDPRNYLILSLVRSVFAHANNANQ